MTPRERVLTSLARKEPDVCPYYIWIHDEMLRPIADYYGDPNFREKFIIDHTVMKEVTALKKTTSNDTYMDEFGCHWRQGEVMHVEKPPLQGASLAGYSFPDLTSPGHYDGMDEWLDRFEDRFKIVQLGMLFFERTWALRGLENYFLDLYDNPRFADELLDGLEEICAGVIDYLLSRYGDRIDAIGFSDDYGSERSLLLSPELWRRYLSPHLERLYRRIHEGNKYVYLHSCGHVEPLLPDFIELGVDMLQPIQPEANDIFQIKRLFGDRICLVGGISTQVTLPFGTPRDIADEVEKCIKYMAPGGGYVMAPAKPILPGVPIENAVALIDAIVGRDSNPYGK